MDHEAVAEAIVALNHADAVIAGPFCPDDANVRGHGPPSGRPGWRSLSCPSSAAGTDQLARALPRLRAGSFYFR